VTTSAAIETSSYIGSNGWTSSIEIRQLRVFLAVFEHRSISAAAVALGLAQSTVSESLAALDRAVGAPTVLRKRGAHNAVLTLAGEAILPHARYMLQQLDAAHCSVAHATRDAAATIAITANESVSTYLLSPALAALRKRWPNMLFSVAVAACASTRNDVAAGRCDLGVLLEGRIGDRFHDGRATDDGSPSDACNAARTTVLADEIPLVVFCGPKHVLARGVRRAPVQRDEASAFPVFMTDGAGDFHEIVRRYFTDDGMPGPRLEAVGSIDGVKRAVASDQSALGILPGYALVEDLELGRARAVELSPAPPRVQLVALLPSAHHDRHPALTELLGLLRKS
jgi:DNA-binding transcriptional LysR family regulator